MYAQEAMETFEVANTSDETTNASGGIMNKAATQEQSVIYTNYAKLEGSVRVRVNVNSRGVIL